MKYSRIPKLINELCSEVSTDFSERTAALFQQLDQLDREAITTHVEYGGVIPESFSHDSSQEKLFAKNCDYLLAKALTILGMNSSVIKERADAADVIANTNNYSLVGDAKAFRLSRTAKNQKDFKIEALNQWKKDADFACLVCPLYQCPTTTSQIYGQAIRYNVTILSFTHLGFLLRSDKIKPQELHKLWQLSGGLTSDQKAVPYWNAVSHQVAKIAGRSIEDWDAYLTQSKKLLHEQAKSQLVFWENEKVRIRGLNHDEAVEALITALRIDSNISLIARTIADLEELIAEID